MRRAWGFTFLHIGAAMLLIAFAAPSLAADSQLQQRTVVWHKMLRIFTDQVFSIGIVNSTLQPVLSARQLRNVPEEGLFGFDPTSYLGVYMPDTFWLDQANEN